MTLMHRSPGPEQPPAVHLLSSQIFVGNNSRCFMHDMHLDLDLLFLIDKVDGRSHIHMSAFLVMSLVKEIVVKEY